MKTVLIVVGATVGVFLLLGFSGYYWFENNKDELMEKFNSAQTDGARFGEQVSQDICVDGALDNYENCEGRIMCGVQAEAFLSSCMREAVENREYCESLPKPGDIIDSAKWLITTCEEKGSTNKHCNELIRGIIDLCHE